MPNIKRGKQVILYVFHKQRRNKHPRDPKPEQENDFSALMQSRDDFFSRQSTSKAE